MDYKTMAKEIMQGKVVDVSQVPKEGIIPLAVAVQEVAINGSSEEITNIIKFFSVCNFATVEGQTAFFSKIVRDERVRTKFLCCPEWIVFAKGAGHIYTSMDVKYIVEEYEQLSKQ
jgi:hypothetical protein